MAPKARRVRPSEVEVTIAEIGGRGDGVARQGDAPLFVAGTAPGDRVRVRLRERRGDGLVGDAIELIAAGPQRADPPCPHFGACGGCLLQHLKADVYADWKGHQVRTALDRRGLVDVAVAATVATPPASRRRARLTARRSGDRVFLGFHEHRSNRVVDVTDCRVMVPPLLDVLAPLRSCLAAVLDPSEGCQILLTALDDGVDVLIEAGRPAGLSAREALAAFAHDQDLARVGWRIVDLAKGGPEFEPPEPIAARRTGVLTLADRPVAVPQGAFLQASREAEGILTRHVLAALDAPGRVADLFCGIGTFALPLACQGHRVRAVDSDGAAVAALDQAARLGQVAARLTVDRRNLYSRPLDPAELADVDAVVFDPPRLGARDQAAALAQSSVPVVVAISCNPSTFSRDARILVDGGYRCAGVTPLDQFVWSPHVELIAQFRRC